MGAMLALFAPMLIASEAGAVDLTGKTVRAEGISKRMAANGANKDFTYPLEIYFSSKGNRFVMMKFTSLDTRIVIEEGKSEGRGRTKNGHWTHVVTVQQTSGSLRVVYDSRGAERSYADERWTFDIALSGNGCTVQKFKYTGSPGVGFIGTTAKPGNCTIIDGPTANLAD